MKYFDIKELINSVPDAHIYMVIGERSNGKTHSALSYAMERYVEEQKTFVYIRRLAESIRAQYMRNLFNGNRKSGDLYKYTKQMGWVDISYFSGTFWATIENEKGKSVRSDISIGYVQAVSTWETSKGSTLMNVGTIIFDEFLTRGSYFDGEPTMFENLVSSIVREENNVKVIMLANTVSWTSPYFREWGINHVREMKQGTYDVYQSGDGKRKIVVCYTEHAGPKASDVYFNYDNPRSRMITSGVWETADYPKIPEQSRNWFRGEACYVQSIDEWTVKLQPVCTEEGLEAIIVYGSPNTIITEDGVDKRFADKVVYTDYFYPFPNCRFAITKHNDPLSIFILSCFKQGRVFYQNNTVGENMRNYLRFSTRYSPIPN